MREMAVSLHRQSTLMCQPSILWDSHPSALDSGPSTAAPVTAQPASRSLSLGPEIQQATDELPKQDQARAVTARA